MPMLVLWETKCHKEGQSTKWVMPGIVFITTQGRVRLMARWAIAQDPGLSRGPKKEKKWKKEYENWLSRNLGAPKLY